MKKTPMPKGWQRLKIGHESQNWLIANQQEVLRALLWLEVLSEALEKEIEKQPFLPGGYKEASEAYKVLMDFRQWGEDNA